MFKNEFLSRNFSKIGLIGDAGFDDGTGLLDEFVTHGNQGELAVLAFGHEAVIERLTRCVSFLGREAAPKQLTTNQSAAHARDAGLAAHTRARTILARAKARFRRQLPVGLPLGKSLGK